MDGTRSPGAARRNQPLLWSGVGAVVVGAVLLLYGAWPLGYAAELMKGPGSDPGAVGDGVDAMMAEAKARVWADALGLVLLLAGMAMVPASKPKPRSVDEIVEEKLRERGRLTGSATGSPASAPVAVAQPPPPAPAVGPSPVPPRAAASVPAPMATVPPPTASAAPPAVASPPASGTRRTHCAACGSILVAGGRICPRGHPQA